MNTSGNKLEHREKEESEWLASLEYNALLFENLLSLRFLREN